MGEDQPGKRAGGADDGGGGSGSPVQNQDGAWGEADTGGGSADPVATAPGEQYCSNCGSVIAEAAELCPECGVRPDGEAQSGATNTSNEPSGRYLSAFVGGIVSFVVGWIPLIGPAAGGVVAGYLRGSDTKESAITGLVANVIAAIPMMGLALLFMVLGCIGAAAGGEGDAALGLFVCAIIFLASFVYFFVLGAAGGALGAAITNRDAP